MALSNLGLIQMGGAMLRPGGSLGDGFLAYGDGMVRDDQMKTTALYRQAQAQSLNSAAMKHQMELEAARAQAEARKNFQSLFASRVGGQPATVSQASAPAAPESGLNGPLGSGTFGIDPLTAMAKPSAPAASTPANKPLWDALLFQRGLDAGYKREDLEAMARASDLGMPEVARTIEQADDLGNPQTVQFDKQGRPVGAPIRKPVSLNMEDFGGHKQFTNPHTGAIVGNQFGKTATIGETESARHNRVTEGINFGNLKARQQEVSGTNNKQAIDLEMKLADDYRTESKDFKQIFPAVGKIKAALPMASKSAPATLAAATSFMKLLDPGSVVRESELGMALHATGVIDRLSNYVSRLQNGQVLTPDQAAEFDRVVDQVYKSAVDSQRLIDDSYSAKARQYGVRADMIIGGPNANSKHPTQGKKNDLPDLPSTADIDAAIARKLQFQDNRGR